MVANETPVTVGTVLLYTPRHGEPPVTVNVSKVTKTGLIRVTFPNGSESELYKASNSGYPDYRPSFTAKGDYSATLFPNTPENLAMLVEWADKAKADRDAKEAENRARRFAREEQEALELFDVKARLGGDYGPFILHKTLLGEDRFLTIGLPVKAEMVERKGDLEMVVLKLKNEKDWMDGGDRVVGYMTLANKSNSSFSSYSGVYGKTDEEVIWECLRTAYRSW